MSTDYFAFACDIVRKDVDKMRANDKTTRKFLGRNIVLCNDGDTIRGTLIVGQWIAVPDEDYQQAVNSYDAMREALKQIAKGEGAFSVDPLTHAGNCIEEMKGIAKAALALAERE